MTREGAVQAIYQVINSGIIDMELEEELTEVCNCIEDDNWEDEGFDDEEEWEE